MLTLRYGSGKWAAPQKFHPGGAAEEERAALPRKPSSKPHISCITKLFFYLLKSMI